MPARSGSATCRSPTSTRASRSCRRSVARCSSSRANCRSRGSRLSPIRKARRSAWRSSGAASPIRPSRPHTISSGRIPRARRATGARVLQAPRRVRVGAAGVAARRRLPRPANDARPRRAVPPAAADRRRAAELAALRARQRSGGLRRAVPSLGGRVVVPAAPERRNGSLAVIADPGGAVLALQKYPF